MHQKIASIGASIGDLWCQTMHSQPMWPVGGEYKCRQCQRSFKVPWEQKQKPAAAQQPVPGKTAVVTTSAAQVA